MGERLARSAVIVFVVITVSRILGFIREVVLAAVFGAGAVTDAYTITFAIPAVLFQAVGDAITTVVIPMLTRYRVSGRDDDFGRVAWTLFHGLLLLLLVMLVVSVGFVDGLVRLFAPGFSGEQFLLTRRLALIMLPGIVFMGLTGWMRGVLNSAGDVITPAAVGIPQNLVLIAGTYFLGRLYGIESVAWASLGALAAQVLLQWRALRRIGLPYRPVLQWRHPDLRAALAQTGPVLAATGTAQISQTLERALASGLQAGSAASLAFAQRVIGLPQGLLIVPVVTVLYPELTRLFSAGDRQGFLNLLRQGLRLYLFLLVPITTGLLFLGTDVVRLLFERGRFDAHATQMTAFALSFLALGLNGWAWRDLLSRALYSMGDTWTPASTGMATVGLHILLSLVLVRFLAHGGIALSWSLTLWLGALVLLVRLRSRVGPVHGRSLLVGAGQAAMGSLLMAGVLAVLRRGPLSPWLEPASPLVMKALALAALAAVGAVVYGAVLYVLRVEEWSLVGKLWKRMGLGALGQLGVRRDQGAAQADGGSGQVSCPPLPKEEVRGRTQGSR